MALSDTGVLLNGVVYTPMKNQPALATQYTTGVTANKPFSIRHFEKLEQGDRKRIKIWYFDHIGDVMPKHMFKLFKAKARRGVLLEYNNEQ